MNRKAEVKITPLIMSMLIMFFFISLVTVTIGSLGSSGYDVSDFNQSDLDNYNYHDSLSSDVAEAADTVTNVVVDPNLFDWFAGIFNSVLSPFKTIYSSYKTLITMTTSVATDLSLLPMFIEFMIAAIMVLVVIGIVMIKFFLNKQK